MAWHGSGLLDTVLSSCYLDRQWLWCVEFILLDRST